MLRAFLIVVAVGSVLLAVAGVILGTFPPNPITHPVEKVLPNQNFRSR